MTNTNTTFNDPATGGGDKLPLQELNGSLLLFTVHELIPDINTTFGPADAISCDVAVLDGPSKGETYERTFIFPRVLVSALRPNIGAMVLGRLGQGEAKAGQSPPWTLAAASEDEKTIRVRYLEYAAKQKADTESPF